MATAVEDDELAGAVYRVLATLTDLRGAAAAPDVLRGRIALVRWLRHELAEVETLLADAAERRPVSQLPVDGVRAPADT